MASPNFTAHISGRRIDSLDATIYLDGRLRLLGEACLIAYPGKPLETWGDTIDMWADEGLAGHLMTFVASHRMEIINALLQTVEAERG